MGAGLRSLGGGRVGAFGSWYKQARLKAGASVALAAAGGVVVVVAAEAAVAAVARGRGGGRGAAAAAAAAAAGARQMHAEHQDANDGFVYSSSIIACEERPHGNPSF